MLQELSEDNLAELIENNPKVVVQYTATWCGNCRIMKPKFKKLASENTETIFVIADAEKFPLSRKLATVDNFAKPLLLFLKEFFKDQIQTNKFDVFKRIFRRIIMYI